MTAWEFWDIVVAAGCEGMCSPSESAFLSDLSRSPNGFDIDLHGATLEIKEIGNNTVEARCVLCSGTMRAWIHVMAHSYCSTWITWHEEPSDEMLVEFRLKASE